MISSERNDEKHTCTVDGLSVCDDLLLFVFMMYITICICREKSCSRAYPHLASVLPL
jgi:hypothetical protein